MKRIPLLGLGITAVVAAVASVWWNVSYSSPYSNVRVALYDGRLGFAVQSPNHWYTTNPWGERANPGWHVYKPRINLKPTLSLFQGYRKRTPETIANYPTLIAFEIPTWLLCVLGGFPVMFWLGRRTARRSPYVCQKCGYLLIGRLTSRCPECGAPNPFHPYPGKKDEGVAPSADPPATPREE